MSKVTKGFDIENRKRLNRRSLKFQEIYVGLWPTYDSKGNSIFQKYLFRMPKSVKDRHNYIEVFTKTYIPSNVIIQSFNADDGYLLANEEEKELFEDCEKAGKWVEPSEKACYIIKTTIGNDYIAAVDKQGKISWVDGIEDILKYLNDGLKISYKGAVNYKPKTLKDLKELIK